MQIIVQSKNIPVTAALRSFIEEQAGKLAHKSHRIQSVLVVIEAVSRKHNEVGAAVVKFCVSMPGRTMCVSRQAIDMYAAILDTADRTGRAIRKLKERKLSSRRMPAFM
jgi:putative sigma-54 modulation protein